MNNFTKEELSVTINYVDATKEQLNHFLCAIESKKCIYPWESKAERLKRFEGLEVSRQAILRELGLRYRQDCLVILSKIQSMIDNYCDCEETVCIGGWVSKCVKCGKKFGDETQ